MVLDRPDATADQAGKVLDALVPFVLLVDDADALCSRGEDFEDGFFEAIRTLVQRGALTWVSASRRNLYDAFKTRGLTSRFLNDALKISVGPLSKAAAVELALRGPAAEVATRSDEPEDLDPAAIVLAREGYLERHGDKVTIVVPLFREWIRMNII